MSTFLAVLPQLLWFLVALWSGYLTRKVLFTDQGGSHGPHSPEFVFHSPSTWNDLFDREDFKGKGPFRHDISLRPYDTGPEKLSNRVVNGFPGPKYLPYIT
jgi:hypothetical protein